MAEREEAAAQMEGSLAACLDTGLPVAWVYPNSDLGYGAIVDLIRHHRNHEAVFPVSNLERDDYLRLLANAVGAALRTALGDEGFRARCADAVNPYGDGHSSERICRILDEVVIDRALMDKETTF